MKLYAGGYLTFFMPEKQPELVRTLDQPVALIDFLAAVGIPVAEVQLVIVNGQVVELESVCIGDQDNVSLFPGVDGG